MLSRLLQAKTKWQWTESQEKAFKVAKSHLTSSALLVHFDQEKELVLACDASPYGVGAVLSHSPAEKKYAQLEKEGLAIVFGVKRFRQYLYGHKFHIYSDHRSLERLFSESRPVLASARIQRWAQLLGGYTYTISYKSGNDHGNADSLS